MVLAGLEGLEEESVGGVKVVFAPLCPLVCVDFGVEVLVEFCNGIL